ncbi:MAG: hypothetical protein WBB97_05520 [Dehalococcoidales bacterium]
MPYQTDGELDNPTQIPLLVLLVLELETELVLVLEQVPAQALRSQQLGL